MKAMNGVGQKAINDKTLMKVLSVKPVLNRYVTDSLVRVNIIVKGCNLCKISRPCLALTF